MNKEQFDAVLGYFSENNISVPTDVRNAIEDVFLENDVINGVECYHKEDLEQFQEDLTLENIVRMSLKGTNRGITNNVWTYYGNLSYSLSESILLVDEDDTTIEEISNIQNTNKTVLETPNDWAIVLIEKVMWDTVEEKLERNPVLFIYCPTDGDLEAEKYIEMARELTEPEMEM